MMHISSADQTRSVKNILPFPVSFCRWGAFKKANIKQLNIKDFFKHRTSTGSEVFLILKCLDATKFVLLSFFYYYGDDLLENLGKTTACE